MLLVGGARDGLGVVSQINSIDRRGFASHCFGSGEKAAECGAAVDS